MEFKSLFQWNGERVEDVRFWCEPKLTREALAKIPSLGFPPFDAIATFEARGFYLAGMLDLPAVLIRKHKRFYEKMPHERVDYVNWKGEAEALTVLKGSMPAARRVLVIDDILDTGNSLRAGVTLLARLGIEVVGAFYLLDASSGDFPFPVHSVLKKKLF